MRVRLWLRMVALSLRAPFLPPFGPRRALALLVFTPVFVVLQTVHWIAFALDDLLWPEYRRARVREPLFVVGFPRSGTSFLHATLAEDEERFVTPPLWELVLAPAIVERRLAALVTRMDALLGGPLGRLVQALEGRLSSELRDINPVGLEAPGEDQLLLTSAFACFVLVAVHPLDPAVWRLMDFDAWPLERRREIMEHYRGLVRRHLFAHGAEDRRYLSKNPSFTSMAGSLGETFAGARVVFCYRDPAEAVPSQLSSLRPAAAIFGWDPASPPVRARFLGMYSDFARQGTELLREMGDRAAAVALPELAADPSAAVLGLYERFGWTASERFHDALRRRDRRSGERRSAHDYSPEEFGLSVEDLGAPFDAARRRFGPTPTGARS